MLIKVDFEIAFEFPEPTPIAMMMYLHPSRDPTVRNPERLTVTPSVAVSQFTDGFGSLSRASGCEQGLHPLGDYPLPLPEYSG